MSFLFTLIILLVVAGGVIYGYSQFRKMKAWSAKGILIQRDGAFWEDGEYLSTKASWQEILDAIVRTDFSDCGVEITPNYEGSAIVLFDAGSRFRAALVYYGEENGENIFEFCFPVWNDRHLASSAARMNVLMTIVEKLFLSLDPDTEAELHIRDTKTVTRFF